MMTKTQCIVCEMDDSEPYLLAKDTLGITDRLFSIVRCKKCGLIYLNPAPDPNEMENFYPKGYWAIRENKIEGYYRDIMINLELRLLRNFIGQGGKLLDVGSGPGEFLYHAEKLGYKSYGVELSEEMVKYSIENFGLSNIITSDFLSASFPEDYFDIILFNHVLEHLYHPIENLMKARRILRKEGTLVIQIPNINSYQFSILKQKWLGLSVPQHLYHFSPQTISFVLEKLGFHVSKILHYSIRNSATVSTLSLTGMNPFKLHQEEKKGRSVFLKKLSILYLNLFFIPLTLLEAGLKKGGIITVFAKKIS